MKAFRQLGFLRLALGQQSTPDDHRVIALFRNRAELKKAYGDLREEVDRLKDRLKQQEGVTRRVQETLDALETRLGSSETAYPALVFFQLRRLWVSGHEHLERFGTELAAQQEERERRQHLAEHNRRQFARRHAAEQRLRLAEQLAAHEHERLLELQRRHDALRRLWHFFKRRALEPALAHARAGSDAAETSVTAARRVLTDVAAEPIPDFPGLSLEGRRAINLAVIAYAELLCLKLAPMPLLVMRAREATWHREVIDVYGSREECAALMSQIERADALLRPHARLSQEIRLRTDRLRPLVRYRDPEHDAIPLAEFLASDTDAAVTGTGPMAGVPNVLAENTWDIHGVLLT